MRHPEHPGSEQEHPGSEREHPGSEREHPGSERGHPGSEREHPGSERGHPGRGRTSRLCSKANTHMMMSHTCQNPGSDSGPCLTRCTSLSLGLKGVRLQVGMHSAYGAGTCFVSV